MTPLTPADLARLRQLAAAAIPGPWQYSRRNWRGEEQARDWYVVGNIHESGPDDGEPCVLATSVCVVPGNDTSHPVCKNTAAFIAALDPATVLALLDRLAEAESSRDWLRALLDNMPGPARPIGGGMYAGPAGP